MCCDPSDSSWCREPWGCCCILVCPLAVAFCAMTLGSDCSCTVVCATWCHGPWDCDWHFNPWAAVGLWLVPRPLGLRFPLGCGWTCGWCHGPWDCGSRCNPWAAVGPGDPWAGLWLVPQPLDCGWRRCRTWGCGWTAVGAMAPGTAIERATRQPSQRDTSRYGRGCTASRGPRPWTTPESSSHMPSTTMQDIRQSSTVAAGEQ